MKNELFSSLSSFDRFTFLIGGQMMDDHIGHVVSIGVPILVNAVNNTEFHVVHADETVRRSNGLNESIELSILHSRSSIYHSGSIGFRAATPNPGVLRTDGAQLESFATVDRAFFARTTDENKFGSRFLFVLIFDQPAQRTRIKAEFPFFARLRKKRTGDEMSTIDLHVLVLHRWLDTTLTFVPSRPWRKGIRRP